MQVGAFDFGGSDSVGFLSIFGFRLKTVHVHARNHQQLPLSNTNVRKPNGIHAPMHRSRPEVRGVPFSSGGVRGVPFSSLEVSEVCSVRFWRCCEVCFEVSLF